MVGSELRSDWKQSISKLYDVDYKPFMTKISRYKDEYELMDAIERFLSSKTKSFEKDDVKALLSNDLKLVFENENILIVRTYTHESISLIGSDTSWCIVSSAYTFKNYTSKGAQFVLFDYTKDRFESDFKIGFTLNSQNMISYAHDVFDKSVIPYTKELLEKNGVDLDVINVVPKPDISNLSTKTSSYDLLDFVQSNNIIKYDDIFRKILSIASSKLSETPLTAVATNGRRTRRRNINYYNLTEVFIEMFRKLKNHIGHPLEIEEFDAYKSELGESYNKVIKLLNDCYDLIIISDIPPKNIFSNTDILLKNYKRWNHEIKIGNPNQYINYIEQDPLLVEPILYYCGKGRINNTKKLVAAYCNMVLGEKINMTDVKNIINRSFNNNISLIFLELNILMMIVKCHK